MAQGEPQVRWTCPVFHEHASYVASSYGIPRDENRRFRGPVAKVNLPAGASTSLSPLRLPEPRTGGEAGSRAVRPKMFQRGEHHPVRRHAIVVRAFRAGHRRQVEMRASRGTIRPGAVSSWRLKIFPRHSSPPCATISPVPMRREGAKAKYKSAPRSRDGEQPGRSHRLLGRAACPAAVFECVT